MVSTESIQELRRQTSVSSLDAMHALSVSDGDIERAKNYLHTPRLARKALLVNSAEVAAPLAARLVASGLWFECEQLSRQQWRFSVVPAGHDHAIALLKAILVPVDPVAITVTTARPRI